jgi:natural product precursor
MRRKQTSKLPLNSETIRALATRQYTEVKGGGTISPNPCGGGGSGYDQTCTGSGNC